jgi:hypothetical protein
MIRPETRYESDNINKSEHDTHTITLLRVRTVDVRQMRSTQWLNA